MRVLVDGTETREVLDRAATPADWRPRIIAAPCRATAAGSSPNERIPIAELPGSDARSRTGA